MFFRFLFCFPPAVCEWVDPIGCDEVAAPLHCRLQQLLQLTQGVLQDDGKGLCVSLLAAVEGGDGEVDVVRLGVVTNGVTVGNQWPETHHAVRVRWHLE